MHHIKGAVFLIFLISAMSPLSIGQLRNFSEFSQDRIHSDKTYFVLHEIGAPEFGWASEWTHTTANDNEGKSAIFVWHFKDGSKAYSLQAEDIGEIGKNSGYLLINRSSNLEDINRQKIQPLTLNNYPVKVELWIGKIGDSKGYSPEILGETACVAASSIGYGIRYRFSSCQADEKALK
jgi:hypothetical protein